MEMRNSRVGQEARHASTALWMSRHDIDIPIYALTPLIPTQRKLALFRNVQAFDLEASGA